MDSLAKKITEIRELANLNQVQFAKAVGTDQSVISSWESGRAEPSLTSLIRIAKFADMTIDELLEIDSINKNAINPKLMIEIRKLNKQQQSELATFLAAMDFDQ